MPYIGILRRICSWEESIGLSSLITTERIFSVLAPVCLTDTARAMAPVCLLRIGALMITLATYNFLVVSQLCNSALQSSPIRTAWTCISHPNMMKHLLTLHRIDGYV